MKKVYLIDSKEKEEKVLKKFEKRGINWHSGNKATDYSYFDDGEYLLWLDKNNSLHIKRNKKIEKIKTKKRIKKICKKTLETAGIECYDLLYEYVFGEVSEELLLEYEVACGIKNKEEIK